MLKLPSELERQLFADRDVKPGPVPKEVLDYWRAKKLRVGFDYRDVWREEHDVAFSAAKVMREDVLAVMQEQLEIAIEEGHPYEKFKREIEPRLKSLGWWDEQQVRDPKTGKVVSVDPPKRLHTIFHTNMRTSRAVGQYERARRNVKSRPYLLYQVGPSKRHREQHLAWHGVLLPFDDDFWAFAYPPNGWGCKCHVRTVSEREHRELVDEGVLVQEPILDDDGVPTGHVKGTRVPVQTTAPMVPLVAWKNKRTGRTEYVPQGIDPGFDKLPGEGRTLALEQKKRESKKRAKKR